MRPASIELCTMWVGCTVMSPYVKRSLLLPVTVTVWAAGTPSTCASAVEIAEPSTGARVCAAIGATSLM